MNRHFIYNFATKTIVGSKRSIERANRGLSPEYDELVQMLAAQPTFSIVPKLINQKKDKKTYNKLTLDRMKEYIALRPNSEAMLIEFEAIKRVAELKGAKYPLTKKWFFDKYPEYKEREALLPSEDANSENNEAA